jgi:hypothetical protein
MKVLLCTQRLIEAARGARAAIDRLVADCAALGTGLVS